MAKNIPITARVSRGLFGQKATEPVLNVGQAGVYGNNVTKGDPSPAKMMMKSPLKQVKSESAGDKIVKGQASVKSSSPGTDKVVKGGTKVIPGKKYVPRETAAWRRKYNTPEKVAAYNKKKKEEIANDPEYQPKTIQEPDRIEKGEPTEMKEPLKVFNEGSAKTSFWRRQDDRSVTHTSRKKKRADIQLAKLEAEEKGFKGKEKRDYINNAKTKAKKEMWESRQAGYKGSRDAAIKQSQQSTTVHDKIKGTYVDPKGEQVLLASQVGSKGVSESDAKTQGRALGGFDISETPKTTNTNTELTKNTNIQEAAKPLAETKSVEVRAAEKLGDGITIERKTPTSQMTEDDTPPASVAEKKVNGFFAKKSPLKMKYFK